MAHSVEYGHHLERLEPTAVRTRQSRSRFAADEIRGPYPEVRIICPVDYEASADWELFLSKVGSQNRGKGIARSLGSMTLTVISAQESGKMLGDYYGPAYYNNRGNALNLMYRFAKKFNRFVAREMHLAADARFDERDYTAISEMFDETSEESFEGYDGSSDIRITPDDDVESKNIDRDENFDVPHSIWEPLGVKVKGIDKFSRNGFGLDVSSDRMLARRISGIIDYVRHEGLATHHIDPNRTPHTTFFDGYSHLSLGNLIMKDIEIGKEIVFGSPEAVVNPNGNIQ